MPDRVARDLVLLAEAGRHVDDTGAVLGRDEVAAEHLERVRRVGEEVEQRRVTPADELAALERADSSGLGELTGVVLEPRLGQDVARAVGVLHHGVVDVGADRHREVGGQRPRRRRPDQDPVAVRRACSHTVSAGSWRSR